VENGAGLARGHVMLWVAERTDQANLPNQELVGWRWTLLAIKNTGMEWLGRGSNQPDGPWMSAMPPTSIARPQALINRSGKWLQS
jgi:hypothetical protein